MSTSGLRGNEYPPTDRVNANTQFTVFANGETFTCNVDVLFANVTSNVVVLTSNAVPANSTNFVGKAGSLWSDGNYVYFATSNTTVKRTALSSF